MSKRKRSQASAGAQRASNRTSGISSRQKPTKPGRGKRLDLQGDEPVSRSQAQKYAQAKFAENVGRLCKRRGLELMELARWCKIKPAKMWRMVAGEVAVGLATILWIAECLDVEPHVLLRGVVRKVRKIPADKE